MSISQVAFMVNFGFSLQKDPKDRKPAQALLVCSSHILVRFSFALQSGRIIFPWSLHLFWTTQAHPFLSMYADLNIDLASYFTTAGSPLATF